jgi:hypothetical protein
MKCQALTLVGVIGLGSFCIPGVSWAWPAKVFGVPGYGECAADTKHARIPDLKTLPYDAAKAKLVALGWQPKVTREKDKWRNGQETAFWERGDTEVGSCAVDRAVACRFNYVDKSGNWLVVFTQGEEARDIHRAIVTYAGVLCPDK